MTDFARYYQALVLADALWRTGAGHDAEPGPYASPGGISYVSLKTRILELQDGEPSTPKMQYVACVEDAESCSCCRHDFLAVGLGDSEQEAWDSLFRRLRDLREAAERRLRTQAAPAA